MMNPVPKGQRSHGFAWSEFNKRDVGDVGVNSMWSHIWSNLFCGTIDSKCFWAGAGSVSSSEKPALLEKCLGMLVVHASNNNEEFHSWSAV